MANCIIRPSLLNKFTFRPVYVPPPGDAHRIICHDATRNIMFSPEDNNGLAVIHSPNLGRTFQKLGAPSLLEGDWRRWCRGSEGFLLARPDITTATTTRIALTESGMEFTRAHSGGGGAFPTENVFFGNSFYFRQDRGGSTPYSRWGSLQGKVPLTFNWVASYGFATAANGRLVYLRGRIYGFQGGPANPYVFRSGTGTANDDVVMTTDFPEDRMPDVIRHRLLLTGRDLDTLSILSDQGTLWRSENAGANWIEGAPIGIDEYNGRWPWLWPGLGRFGEEVILTICDNGEVGALTLDRGETWRLFDTPEFLRYVGDWNNVEISYVDGRWLGAFGNYGIWELTPDYRS